MDAMLVPPTPETAESATDAPSLPRGVTAMQRLVLIGLLIAAILLQDLVWLVAIDSSGGKWPAAAGIVGMGLAFGQVGLAALLLSVGRGPLIVRGFTAIGIHIAGCFVASRATDLVFEQWLGVMSLVALLVALTPAIARIAGITIATSDVPPAAARSRQFTLWGLLSLTTIVAAILGLARVVNFPWESLGRIAGFGTALAAIPWTIVFLTLNRRIPWSRSLLGAAVVSHLAGWSIAVSQILPHGVSEMIEMCVVQGAVTFAACAIARLAGYRWVWPGMQR